MASAVNSELYDKLINFLGTFEDVSFVEYVVCNHINLVSLSRIIVNCCGVYREL